MNLFKWLIGIILKHKIISVIIIIVLIGSGFFVYKSFASNTGVTRYVLAEASKQTIVSAVSATGQTVSVNEVDIKPKTSGDLTYVSVVGGQTVSKGALIAQIDPTSAQRAVDSAQQALDTANVNLEKMKGVETDLGRLRGDTEKAQDNLDTTYESGFNAVTNAFLSLPTVMTGLQDILLGTDYNKYQQNISYYVNSTDYDGYKTIVEASYTEARTAYDKSFADFKNTNRTSSKDQIESIINDTYDTIGKISQAIKDTINLIQFYQDELTKHDINPATLSDTHLSSLSSYVSTTNTHLSSLLSTKTNIENDKEDLIQTGYDIADQEILVKEKEEALADAKTNLSYCYIYAPFSGVISAVNVKAGDSVSQSTALAKIVTKDVQAEVSLNEVEASKIKIGQKVTTTFDAIEGLTLTGVVYSIDTVGTVSQGVVSYTVQINFDTQDERVKAGMSVSSSIITNTAQNVLAVPNSAIKTKNGSYYVLVLDQAHDLTSSSASQGFTSETTPSQKTVEVGVSDDTNTQIISGLAEGDQVVTKTTSSAKTATATGSSTTQTTNRATQSLIGGGGPPN
jgi:RND family efflux transporter MFP subunit